MIFHDCVTILSILADFGQFPMIFIHLGRILYVCGQSYRIVLHFPLFLSIYSHFVELLMFSIDFCRYIVDFYSIFVYVCLVVK